jgi:type IV pilus assembly protein PilC
MDLAIINNEKYIETRNLKIKARGSELILFTTQLSVMLESGVVLSDALEAISEQLKPSPFKIILCDISDKIHSGQSFSVALSVYPKVFNSMFVSMVRASEASGKMSEMLDVLSRYLTSEAETRKQVQGAMIYPLIMVMMAIAATGTLMFFVLPRFTKIYESRGAALPALTRVLVKFSSLLGDLEFMTMAMSSIFFAGVVINFWSKTNSGRKTIDYAMISLPAFSTMYIDSVMTRSMRIMATMVNTGVSLLDAIDVIKSSSTNYYFQRLWNQADKKIRDGYQLSDSIIHSGGRELVVPGIIQMIRAGEKSGKMGFVCDKASTFYERKLGNSIKTATALIEPIMITVMGIIIGTIAIALLLPVFRISTIIAH